jgi:hypothetical protein
MRCRPREMPASQINRPLPLSTSPARRCLREPSRGAAASMPERVREEHAGRLARNFTSPSCTHVGRLGAGIAQPGYTPSGRPRPDLRARWPWRALLPPHRSSLACPPRRSRGGQGGAVAERLPCQRGERRRPRSGRVEVRQQEISGQVGHAGAQEHARTPVTGAIDLPWECVGKYAGAGPPGNQCLPPTVTPTCVGTGRSERMRGDDETPATRTRRTARCVEDP